jgi:ribose transport system ATP-binding protein
MTDHISANTDVVLEARNIEKNYGSTIALSGADLVLRSGKIHALMGENGAGKSTLVRILVGATQPTSGSLYIDGEPCTFNSVSSAISAGIVPIYQHLTLFPNLSVLENLFSFENASRGLPVAHRAAGARDRAKESLAQVALDIDLDRLVESLTLGERQLLEIARGIQRDCKVLLLDEPSAALNKLETERLVQVVKSLAGRGVAIVYISHKTDEFRKLADDVTVLRDGKSVIKGKRFDETSIEDLVDAMVGHSFTVSEKHLVPPGAEKVAVRDLVLDEGSPPISLSVKAGEVVGVIGLIGSGFEDIGVALAGSRPVRSGSMRLCGTKVAWNSRDHAVRQGIGYVPADRHADGLFSVRSALDNASASVLPHVSNHAIIDPRAEAEMFALVLDNLALTPNEPERLIQDFSGGNQQKVLVARNLSLPNLEFLVLIEPTRGVDIGARDTIHDVIVDAASAGKAILLVTTDLEELTSLAHRILVIRSQNIVAELPQFTTSDDVVGAMLAED